MGDWFGDWVATWFGATESGGGGGGGTGGGVTVITDGPIPDPLPQEVVQAIAQCACCPRGSGSGSGSGSSSGGGGESCCGVPLSLPETLTVSYTGTCFPGKTLALDLLSLPDSCAEDEYDFEGVCTAPLGPVGVSAVYYGNIPVTEDGCGGWVHNVCPGTGTIIGLEGCPESVQIWVYCKCGSWYLYFSIVECVSCTLRQVTGTIPLVLASTSPLAFETAVTPAAVCSFTPADNDVCGNPYDAGTTCPAIIEHHRSLSDECDGATVTFDVSE